MRHAQLDQLAVVGVQVGEQKYLKKMRKTRWNYPLAST